MVAQKINGNTANDEKAIEALKKDGWKIITIWECDLKPVKVKKTFQKIISKISANGAVDRNVGNYEKHPFFVKKANKAKALLKEAGLPKNISAVK
jgi:hypothetical protein